MTRVRSLVLAAAFAASLATSAAACPSCADARGTKQQWVAYVSIFMTIVPFAAVGGVVVWVRRQVLLARREEEMPGNGGD